jgi:hypothetical protein
MSKLFPAKLTLIIEEAPKIGGWFVTSDAHRGFLYYIQPEEGLPEGLRQVPAVLRLLLVAQMDTDIARANKD